MNDWMNRKWLLYVVGFWILQIKYRRIYHYSLSFVALYTRPNDRVAGDLPWWRSALLAICAGNSPETAQRPVTRSFDVFFDLRLNKRLGKQSRDWWFETLSRPLWAQVEWWLEHWHGWLVKPQWAGSVLGRVTRYEYQVLGSTSILARLDTLVYWEPFSWLTSVGTTRNTVIRLGWSRIGLAVLNLHAAGVGLIGGPAVISGRYNKCHSLQLQNHYAHFPPLHQTHIHAKHNRAEPVMGNGYGFRGIVCWPWQEKSCVIG